MMPHPFTLVTALLCATLMGACVHTPAKLEVPTGSAGPVTDAASGAAADEAPARVRTPRRGLFREADGATRQAPLPPIDLTPLMLSELIAAEIAVQRGATAAAVAKYLELARRTRDPRLAQRSAEIAFFERNSARALEAAELWFQIDPGSLDASQTLSGLLINAGRADEALPHLERLLASESTNVSDGFLQLNRLLARNTDRKAALTIVQRLAAPHSQVAEAHGAIAQAASNAGEDEIAITAARAALQLKPNLEFAALLAAQHLGKRSVAEASALLTTFVQRNPAATEARIALARSLIAEKKYLQALTEFKRVEAVAPDNADVLYALGLLALDSRDYPAAESYLKRTLAREPRDRNLVLMYLAQVSEEQKHFAAAREWLGQVARGDHYFNAQSRIAHAFARDGRLDDGRSHLQAVVTVNNQQRVQMVLAEAQLLRDASRHKDAFEVLEKSLEKLPNHPDLLYESAMTAEKLDRIDILEAQLKKVIQIKPDYAHAYNALGYSLADRNERLAEARDLIEKALKIAPDDAFIIDSMGWVMYRLGDLPRAYELLKKAHDARPDAEIAAHLGEVLWKMNRRAEAERIWNEAIARAPDNDTLKATIKRFKP